MRIVEWNESAERLTGVSAGEAVGGYCWVAIAGRDDAGDLVCYRPPRPRRLAGELYEPGSQRARGGRPRARAGAPVTAVESQPRPDAPASPFAQAPFIVIWELTRACALACVHCRAEAMPHRHPDELTTREGEALIDRIAAFEPRKPLLVLTGGDPLRRRDVADLVRHGVDRGLSVALTPSGTAAVTRRRLEELRDAGLARLAVSLDGSTPEAHDAFRRVRGSHRYTMRIVDDARDLRLPLQINTTVSRETVADLPAIAETVARAGAVLWALFFLIPVGRAQAEQGLSATEIEDVLEWAAGLQGRMPFGVKTTEAPHFHRVLGERAAGRPAPQALGRAGRAVTDGNGFLFVDHVGGICPSGFLPLVAGNVRTDDLVRVYREHPLFRSLRDPDLLGGRCGRCDWRHRCGGSRARAHAATGDPLAEDPGCAYEPPAGRRARPLPDLAGEPGSRPQGRSCREA